MSAKLRALPSPAGAMDVDQDLLSMFSCLGTQDKDVLVNDLHSLLDSRLSKDGCAFFLDMTNWNLQAAVGAYYDYYSIQLPEMSVVREVTIETGEVILPCKAFSKSWRIKNCGHETWPAGVHLIFKGGERMGGPSSIPIPMLKPGEETDVSVRLQSPASPGLYQGQWKLCTASGAMCGDTLWLIITVEDDGVVGLTDQLSSISTADGQMDTSVGVASTVSSNRNEPNPFASPGSGSCLATELQPTSGQTSVSDPVVSDSQSLTTLMFAAQPLTVNGPHSQNVTGPAPTLASDSIRSSNVLGSTDSGLEQSPLQTHSGTSVSDLGTGQSVDYADDMQ